MTDGRSNPDASGRLSLLDLGVLLGLLIVAVGLGVLLHRVFLAATAQQVTIALTNTATVGGIVAGLSLAGLSALSLSGEALRDLRERYGAHVRGVLLGSYGFAATVALGSGVLAAFPGTELAEIVAGYGPPVLIVILVASTYVVTSLYRLGGGEDDEQPPTLKPPPEYD